MMKSKAGSLAIRGFLLLPLLFPGSVFSASSGLPKSTQELLKKFKLDPSVLGNIEKDLQVPKDWLEQAKKEGKVHWRATPATPDDLKILLGSFKERYPFIEVEFYGSNQEDRSVKTLIAYKSGRVLSDVMTSIGGFIQNYKDADALENLKSIPSFQRLPAEAKDPDGLWTGINQLYWCMSYNTKLIGKQDLPRKWEDFLSLTKWHGGKLGLGNRPQIWALNVWQAKGEKWTKDFLTRLFNEVKPQLRREGLSQVANLVAAGEIYGAVPSNYKRPYQLALEGAPIAYTCPEPVPASVEDTVMLKRSPNPYAAKVFLNWLLSKEGQLSQYAFEYAAPLDKELGPKLLPFADQILGKETSYRDERVAKDLEPKLYEFWNGLWLHSGGK